MKYFFKYYPLSHKNEIMSYIILVKYHDSPPIISQLADSAPSHREERGEDRFISDFLYRFNFSESNINVLIIIYLQSVKQIFNMADKSSCIFVAWCLGGNENGMLQSL